MSNKVTRESFLKDVKNHTVKILLNNNLYRHLIISNGESCFYKFEVITWPNYLSIVGDMGNFTFTRVEDMFKFFRSSQDMEINTGYWSEKCVSIDKSDGINNFSIELFKENVLEELKNYLDLNTVEEIHPEILERYSDLLESEDEWEAVSRIRDEQTGDLFIDFWEKGYKEYSHRYIWCCYAIVWAIQQYDLVNNI